MNVRKWIVAVLVVSVIAGMLVAYKVLSVRAEIAASASLPEYSETVAAASAELMPYKPVVNVIGQVVAPQQLELRNELAGHIEAVKFTSGQQVAKGQILIQMDISEELAKMASAKARAQLARATNERISSLRLANAVSQEQQDQTVSQLQVAEADIALLAAMIEKKTLRAPFDAVVGIHQFEVGQYLEENSYITTLVGLQEYLWVDFSLPQFYNNLQPGAAIQIGLVTGPQQNSQDAPLEAVVIARNSTVSSDARTLYYRAQVEKQASVILPNTIVAVRVPVAESELKLAVPSTAVLYSAAGPYVYKLVEDKKAGGYRAKRQSVTPGVQQDNKTIINAGLVEGDRVASDGAFKLSDGLLTYIAQPLSGENPAADSSTQAVP